MPSKVHPRHQRCRGSKAPTHLTSSSDKRVHHAVQAPRCAIRAHNGGPIGLRPSEAFRAARTVRAAEGARSHQRVTRGPCNHDGIVMQQSACAIRSWLLDCAIRQHSACCMPAWRWPDAWGRECCDQVLRGFVRRHAGAPPPPIHTHTRTHRQLSPLLSTNFCCTNGGPLVLCRTQTPPSAAGGEKSKPPPAWQHGSSDLC